MTENMLVPCTIVDLIAFVYIAIRAILSVEMTTPQFETHPILQALLGSPQDRTPVLLKIGGSLACRLTDTPVLEAVSDPEVYLKTVAACHARFGSDGIRIFLRPKRHVEAGDELYVHTMGGRRLGEIVPTRGWTTRLDDPRLFQLDNPEFTAHVGSYELPEPIPLPLIIGLQVPDRAYFSNCHYAEWVEPYTPRNESDPVLIGSCGNLTVNFMASLRGGDPGAFRHAGRAAESTRLLRERGRGSSRKSEILSGSRNTGHSVCRTAGGG